MKLIILGATGPSGQQVVALALAAGHDVTAVCRTPSKITTTHDKLKVVKGDIWSEDSMKEHIAGHDAVLSCLGPDTGGWLAESTFYNESIRPIVAAMKAVNVERLLCITTWCTNGEKGPKLLSWFIVPFFLKKILIDMYNMEKHIMENQSDINYTVVKPPILDHGDVTEKEIKAQEGQQIKRHSYNKIRRSDVARFMLSCLETNAWDRKLVAIGY